MIADFHYNIISGYHLALKFIICKTKIYLLRFLKSDDIVTRCYHREGIVYCIMKICILYNGLAIIRKPTVRLLCRVADVIIDQVQCKYNLVVRKIYNSDDWVLDTIVRIIKGPSDYRGSIVFTNILNTTSGKWYKAKTFSSILVSYHFRV